MSNKKKTAVEWLIEELGEYFPIGIGGIELMVFKAKAMEREQIEDAHLTGLIRPLEYEASKQATDYYNETYDIHTEEGKD